MLIQYRGDLKIKGKKEDIEEFITDNIIHFLDSEYKKSEYFKKKIQIDGYVRYSLKTYSETNKRSWLIGSKENFIAVNNNIHIYEEDKNFVSIMNFGAIHNDIDVDYFVKISKEYNLDISIHAYDVNTKNKRDVDIRQGKIKRNEKFRLVYICEDMNSNIGG